MFLPSLLMQNVHPGSAEGWFQTAWWQPAKFLFSSGNKILSSLVKWMNSWDLFDSLCFLCSHQDCTKGPFSGAIRRRCIHLGSSFWVCFAGKEICQRLYVCVVCFLSSTNSAVVNGNFPAVLIPTIVCYLLYATYRMPLPYSYFPHALYATCHFLTVCSFLLAAICLPYLPLRWHALSEAVCLSCDWLCSSDIATAVCFLSAVYATINRVVAVMSSASTCFED